MWECEIGSNADTALATIQHLERVGKLLHWWATMHSELTERLKQEQMDVLLNCNVYKVTQHVSLFLKMTPKTILKDG